MVEDKRYWDSDVFLGYFNEEPDKYSACEGVLEAANDGKILIVISALTLAEVLYAKKQPKLPIDKRAEIESFFKSPFISVQNVTRKIAEKARDIVWDNNIRPKDAIHVATALTYKIPVLNSFDQQLLKYNKALGNPRLRIEKPHEPGQHHLALSDTS
jgi:predicted nucleic acid-binding protein